MNVHHMPMMPLRKLISNERSSSSTYKSRRATNAIHQADPRHIAWYEPNVIFNDGAKTSHGLRLDSRAALLEGGESGPALKLGNPDQSLLLQAMRYTHPELRMPPDKKLPDHVLKDFATWIKQGAPWPKGAAAQAGFAADKHWAFRPVKELSRKALGGKAVHHAQSLAAADLQMSSPAAAL